MIYDRKKAVKEGDEKEAEKDTGTNKEIKVDEMVEWNKKLIISSIYSSTLNIIFYFYEQHIHKASIVLNN